MSKRRVDPDPDDQEQCGSCENCGCDLDFDDCLLGGGLCNQCQWWVETDGEIVLQFVYDGTSPDNTAQEIAARGWGDQEMGNIAMDVDTAEEIAAIIERVRNGTYNKDTDMSKRRVDVLKTIMAWCDRSGEEPEGYCLHQIEQICRDALGLDLLSPSAPVMTIRCAACKKETTRPGQWFDPDTFVCSIECKHAAMDERSYADLAASGGIVDAP